MERLPKKIESHIYLFLKGNKMNNESVKSLYSLYKLNNASNMNFEDFQNSFYKEFYESLFNNFSIIIKKYNLDHNFIYQDMNLLCFLACFSKNKKDIDFFKRYFTKEQLKHMIKYVNSTGKNIFHFAADNVENTKNLRFLLKIGKNIENPNKESWFEITPINKVEEEYGSENCKWLKIMRKYLNKNIKRKTIKKTIKKNRVFSAKKLAKIFYNSYVL